MSKINALMRALESSQMDQQIADAIQTLVTAYYLELSDTTELEYTFTAPLFKLWSALYRDEEELEDLIEAAEKEASAVVGRRVHTPREER